MFRACLLLGALLARAAGAEEEQPPVVREDDLADFDFTSIKTGDWVEYEQLVEQAAEEHSWTSTFRYACIGEEGDRRIVETDVFAEDEPWIREKRVKPIVRVEVRVNDGKILRAWWGTPGSEGNALKVLPESRASGGGTEEEHDDEKQSEENPPAETYDVKDVSGTETYSLETVPFGEQTLVCQKSITESTGKVLVRRRLVDADCRLSVWVCDKVSFPRRQDLPGNPGIRTVGKPVMHGGLVKSVNELKYLRCTVTITLKGFGSDARATLKEK